MLNFFKGKKDDKKSDFVIEEDDGDDTESPFIKSMQVNLSRLIVYAESADVTLQREVAEKLANEAVKPNRQVQIVEYGGLKLLIPLTRSVDQEVQRLTAHALANLSVNADNQKLMATEGAIPCLIALLDSPVDLIQRQAAKSLANLGVNADNKQTIANGGAIPKLVQLCSAPQINVRIEAIAALANLAVNDNNEMEIVECGGLVPITDSLVMASNGLDRPQGKSERDIAMLEELATQTARALRNLSVAASNKDKVSRLGVSSALETLSRSNNERISQQARRALRNLEMSSGK